MHKRARTPQAHTLHTARVTTRTFPTRADLKGKGKNGVLDEKKDGELMTAHFEQFKPYRSLAAWYMWRAHEDAQKATKGK